MAAKLSYEVLIENGLTPEAAKVVVDLQTAPKPDRAVWFRGKMTEGRASEIEAAFPDVKLERPLWKVKVQSK